MPIHDWTRVEAGIFHDLHMAWIAEIRKALNEGLLPPDYYALVEQHAGGTIPDVLTLQAPPTVEPPAPEDELHASGTGGGTAVAAAAALRQLVAPPAAVKKGRPRTIAVRHVSNHRIVALLEIVSPANKDRRRSVTAFVGKAVAALTAGIHILIVDPFPPGRYDRGGLPQAVWRALDPKSREAAPPDKPLTLMSFEAVAPSVAFVANLAVGAALPAMPLYLRPDLLVAVPLEETYRGAYAGLPAYWRGVVEGGAGSAP